MQWNLTLLRRSIHTNKNEPDLNFKEKEMIFWVIDWVETDHQFWNNNNKKKKVGHFERELSSNYCKKGRKQKETTSTTSRCNESRNESIIRFYWVLLGFTGFYWILLGFTEFYWVLPGSTGSYWVFLGFTGFYWVLLGFKEFYWVLTGCTGL